MAVSPTNREVAGPDGAVEVSGIARLGKRTKHLVKRLRPGDIAIIDHLDLDRVSGEDLVTCGIRCVVNCRESSSGSYPNMGPLLLIQAGIHLVDAPGAPLFDELDDGDPITVRGGDIIRAARSSPPARSRTPPASPSSPSSAATRSASRSSASPRTPIEYMPQEGELLSGKIELPRFDTDFRDRPALIVVRGVDHKRDLEALRPYIRDVKPVLVGVDGGADAIRDEGFKVDMIVGDMDSATEPTLRSGAELVVHAYPDGRAPGRERLEDLGLTHKVVAGARDQSQDVAMLIAAEKGASLIVSVARTSTSSSSSTRAARACPRRSSRACGSARSSSTRRA